MAKPVKQTKTTKKTIKDAAPEGRRTTINEATVEFQTFCSVETLPLLSIITRPSSEKREKVRNTADAYRVMEGMAHDDREKFYVLHLDKKKFITAKELISIGSLTSTTVHPREVFKGAVLQNSESIICVHNHPSGDPTPSNEDVAVTERLTEAGKILGIALIDHVIIGNGSF